MPTYILSLNISAHTQQKAITQLPLYIKNNHFSIHTLEQPHKSKTISITQPRPLEIEISRIVGINNENIRATSFTTKNKEQAERWFNIFINNPDLAESLIF